jgi:hypothetical protein
MPEVLKELLSSGKIKKPWPIPSDRPLPPFYAANREEGRRWYDTFYFENDDIANFKVVVFPELHESILGLIFNSLANTVSFDTVDVVSISHAMKVSPRAHLLTEDPINARSERFFTAWLWRILYDNLFNLESDDKWLPGVWRGYGALRRGLKGMCPS